MLHSLRPIQLKLTNQKKLSHKQRIKITPFLGSPSSSVLAEIDLNTHLQQIAPVAEFSSGHLFGYSSRKEDDGEP